jgi:hypothetical protein
MILPNETKDALVKVAEEKGVYLEGNIIKLIKLSKDDPFQEYITKALENDKENRKKRLGVTKQVQAQNKQLAAKASENEKLMEELKEAVQLAEDAKKAAENDLDLLQKRTQFELIGNIVSYALYVIVGCGIITTAMYATAIFTESTEKTLIGNTWSNLFGILLTNSFSIIGTIMGVKYASDKKE